MLDLEQEVTKIEDIIEDLTAHLADIRYVAEELEGYRANPLHFNGGIQPVTYYIHIAQIAYIFLKVLNTLKAK